MGFQIFFVVNKSVGALCLFNAWCVFEAVRKAAAAKRCESKKKHGEILHPEIPPDVRTLSGITLSSVSAWAAGKINLPALQLFAYHKLRAADADLFTVCTETQQGV